MMRELGERLFILLSQLLKPVPGAAQMRPN
jgi:hypothetical protein